MYLHVRLDYFDEKLKGNQTLFEFNFEKEDDVIRKVILPFINGKNFIFKGVLLNVNEVRQIQIFCTDNNIQSTVDIANANIPNGIIMAYSDEDVLSNEKYCKDVTRQLMEEANASAQPAEKSLDEQTRKSPMVFISHSSKDFEFVEALTDLLQHIGLTSKNLFCSSIPGLWIGLGEDIFDSLRELFKQYNLFVIFVQSPRYYESPVSLNEMGAAWVLQTKSCSILTKDMNYEDMKGVLGNSRIAFKVDSQDAPYRLNDLRNDIFKFLNIQDTLDETRWERERNKFLKEVNQ